MFFFHFFLLSRPREIEGHLRDQSCRLPVVQVVGQGRYFGIGRSAVGGSGYCEHDQFYIMFMIFFCSPIPCIHDCMHRLDHSGAGGREKQI